MAQLQSAAVRSLIACCSSRCYRCGEFYPSRAMVCPHHCGHSLLLRFAVEPGALEHPLIFSVNKHEQAKTACGCSLLRNGSLANNSFSDNSRYSNRWHIKSSHITGVMLHSHCRVLRHMSSRNITNSRTVRSSHSNRLLLSNDGSSSHEEDIISGPQRMPCLLRERGACKWLPATPRQQQTIRIIYAAQTFSCSKKFGREGFQFYGVDGRSSRPCVSKGRLDTTNFAAPDVVPAPPTGATEGEKDAPHEEASDAGTHSGRRLPNNSDDARQCEKSAASNGGGCANPQKKNFFRSARRSAGTAQSKECKTGYCAADIYATAGCGCDRQRSTTITNPTRRRRSEFLTGKSCSGRPENLVSGCKSRATENNVSAQVELERESTNFPGPSSKQTSVVNLPWITTGCLAAGSATEGASPGSSLARHVEASLAVTIALHTAAPSAAQQERAEKTDLRVSSTKRAADAPHPVVSPDASALARCDRVKDTLCTPIAAAQQQQQQVEATAYLTSQAAAQEEDGKVPFVRPSKKTTEGQKGEVPLRLHAHSPWTEPMPYNAAYEGQLQRSSLPTAWTKVTDHDQEDRRTDYIPDVAFAQPPAAGGPVKNEPGYALTAAGSWPLCNRCFDTTTDTEKMERREEIEEMTEREEERRVKGQAKFDRDVDIIEEEEEAAEVATLSIEEEKTASTPGTERPYAAAYMQYLASVPLSVEEEEKVQRIWQQVVHDDYLCRQLDQVWGLPFAMLRCSQLPRRCLRYFKQQVEQQQQLQFSTHFEKDVCIKHKMYSRVGTAPLRSIPINGYSSFPAGLPFIDGVSFTVPEAKGLSLGATVVKEGPASPFAPDAAVLRTTAPAGGATEAIEAAESTVVPRITAGDTVADATSPRGVPAGRATQGPSGLRVVQTPMRSATGGTAVGSVANAAMSVRQTQCSASIVDRPPGGRRKRMLLFILKHLRAAARDRATPLTEGFAEAVRLCTRSLNNSNGVMRCARAHAGAGYANGGVDSSSWVRTTRTAPVCGPIGNGAPACGKPFSNAVAADETIQVTCTQSQMVASLTGAVSAAAGQEEIAGCATLPGREPPFFAAFSGFQSSSGDIISNDPCSTEGGAGLADTLSSAAPGGVCSDTYRTLLQLERRGMAADKCVDYDRVTTTVGTESSGAAPPLSCSGFCSAQHPLTDIQKSTKAAGLRSYSLSRPQLAEVAPLLCLMRWYLAEQHADHVLQYRNLTRLADLRSPAAWYPAARALNRNIVLHAGPPNSGKTAAAVQSLLHAATGCYLAPLRLLAWEIYMQLKQRGIKVSLITGQERRVQKGATHLCCTVEAAPLNNTFACGVIDEAQLVGSHQRGDAWTRALLGLPVQQLHVCCEERAVPLLQKLFTQCKESCCIRHYQRLAPLVVDQQPVGDLEALRTGDCLVCFTRADVLKLRRRLLALGFDVYAIYGQLPPAVKQRQADLFNTAVQHAYEQRFNAPSTTAGPVGATLTVQATAPSTTRAVERTTVGVTPSCSPTLEAHTRAAAGGTHSFTHRQAVLVATDAIGLGLNLHIRRVVFYRLQKYAGSSDGAARLLTAAEIRQLAGRAGRRSGVWGQTGGFVSCMAGEDFERVREAIQGKAQVEQLDRAALLPSLRQLISFCEELERQETPGERTAARREKNLQSVLSSLAAPQGIQAEQQGTSGEVHTVDVCWNGSDIKGGRKTDREEPFGSHACNEHADARGRVTVATAFRRGDADLSANAYNNSATCGAAQTNSDNTAASSEKELHDSSCWRGVTFSYTEAVRCFINLLQVDPLYFVPPHKLNLMLTVVHALADVPLPRQQLFTFCLAPLPFSSPFPFLKHTFNHNDQEHEQQQRRGEHHQVEKRTHELPSDARAREGTYEALRTTRESVDSSRPQPAEATEHFVSTGMNLIAERTVSRAFHAEDDAEPYRRTADADEAAGERDVSGDPLVDTCSFDRACPLPAATLAAAGLSLLLLNSLRTFAVLLATCGHVPLPPHVFVGASEAMTESTAAAVLHPAASLLQQLDEPVADKQFPPAEEHLRAGHHSLRQDWPRVPNERRHPAATAADQIRWCKAQPGGAAAGEHTSHVYPRSARLSKATEEMTRCDGTTCRREAPDAHIIPFPTEERAEGRSVPEAQKRLSSAEGTALKLQEKICCQSHAAAEARKFLTTEEEEAQKDGRRFDERLLLLEEHYQIVDLYVWLARKFPAAFVDLHLALQMQQRLVGAIDAHLNGPQHQ